MFGIVSFIGDTIYEGGRGVIPSYLEFLGASAFIVGASIGLSEFIGYAVRLFSGVAVDATRAYWTFYALGYLLIVSIPVLAFSWNWQVAVLLVFVERFAKALRSPARDFLLSIVSRDVGSGKAFGLHELLDQVGAVLGPSLLAYILYVTSNSYFYAFSSLFIPYALLVGVVVYVSSKLKARTEYSVKRESKLNISSLSSNFKYYVLAVTLNTIGLIHVSLILYRASEIVEAWMVSLLYLLVQGVDAIAAPISGTLYDKYGGRVLAVPFILSILPSILTVIGGWWLILVSTVLFGVIYGMQESIYRAAVVDLAPIEIRGTAYGIFNSTYGLGLFISGVVYGAFISSGVWVGAVVYTVAVEVLALSFLYKSTSQRF